MPQQPAIQQLLTWAKTQLSDSESALVDARVLLCDCLNCTPTYLMTWPERQPEAAQVEAFKSRIEARKAGMPVAYILGYRDFWSLRLKVAPSTLIPRPETELLVELALGLSLPEQAEVLDLGTGTGAIALALATEHADWQICGVDKQSDAVALAKKNAADNQLPDVEFYCGDWFAPLQDRRFDLIVSNPPYVEQNSPWLQQGDVRYEPNSALTSGEDGLDDIRHIASQVSGFLKPGGWLLLEHGYSQGNAVHKILAAEGGLNVTTHQDLSGLDRVSLSQWR